MHVLGFIVSTARLSGRLGTRKGEEYLSNVFITVSKKHGYSVGLTFNVLRLHIQNFSNHLVPKRLTAVAPDRQKSDQSCCQKKKLKISKIPHQNLGVNICSVLTAFSVKIPCSQFRTYCQRAASSQSQACCSMKRKRKKKISLYSFFTQISL